jgi:TRAP-type mannitol/chloroaromatic compound transport system substrate-binding protein
LNELVAKGTKLRAFSDEIMNASYKASNEIHSERSAKNANWKKVYDDTVKFRADQNLWFRFAEAQFDRFTQTQRL